MPIVDYDKGFKVKVGHKSWEIFVQTYDNAQPPAIKRTVPPHSGTLCNSLFALSQFDQMLWA
jgi:hypothetical protein